jgi:DNA-3-methyladenine glycosylase II
MSRAQSVRTLLIRPEPPYRLDLTAWALRRRRRNEIDRWDGAYVRVLLIESLPVEVRVEQVGHMRDPVLHVRATSPAELSETACEEVRSQIVRLLGVEIDMGEFYELADAHPGFAELKDRFLGMRPPRFPGIFEALANAVANQQLSLEVGLTLLNRMAAAFGTASSGDGGPAAFPSAEDIAVVRPDEVRRLGFSAAKTDYLLGIADAVAAGALDERVLERVERAEAQRQLLALRGVGRWSAEYVLLRGLGRLDVYPGDDVGARNALRGFFGLDHDPGYDEIQERLEPLDGVSGLLYFHLLLAGLAERGDIVA